MSSEHCDVLIVGSGIAGLSFALYLTESNPDMEIMLVSKGDLEETNTRLAQGGIAAVTENNPKDISSHIEDTLVAGRGHCDPNVVKMVVNEAGDRIMDLVRWGVLFDREGDKFHLHREGGHSLHRILHRKDFTGAEIHQKLLQWVKEKTNIRIKSHCFVSDLIMAGARCIGVYYYPESSGHINSILAKSVMLATGGSGQMFRLTTNSADATGDGLAMASRAGAVIKDLQFYQFHPTVLYQESQDNVVLISEAVRGFGAHVINKEGRRFLFDYDPAGELAPRDTVTNAIFRELEATGEDHVYLAIRHLDINEFAAHFPTIWKQCTGIGLDLTQDDIPILPAAHYQCGGIKVDQLGRTTVDGLYAGGECACTGLHGANRLASNSLLEAVVFAYRSAGDVIEWVPGTDRPLVPGPMDENYGREILPEEMKAIRQIRKELQRAVSKAYYHRTEIAVLEKTLKRISEWKVSLKPVEKASMPEVGELRNLLESGSLMISALLEAK